MSDERNEDQQSSENEKPNTEPERDAAPPDIDLVFNSEDPEKNRNITILTEKTKK